MTIPHQPAPSPAPSVAQISAAMAALGVYASVPSEAELEQQARSVGGEHVLAAILANALYGAAIGTGMLTEGHMLEAGAGARELGLAREQVLKASGADAIGVIGVLHWQSGQVRQTLKNMTNLGDGGPLLGAAARASNALLDLLACTTVFSVDDARAEQIPDQLIRARRDLEAAIAQIDALPSALAALLPDDVPS